MAGEDLLEDDTSAGGKKKHKPLTKGQKIGIAIGIVTILIILYQVHKQSAANAAASSSGSSGIDPLTGYPSGSAQDQQALSSMYGQSANAGTTGYTGGGGGGYSSTGGLTDAGIASDVAAGIGGYFSTVPSTSPLSPNYVPPDTTQTSASPTPVINITVPTAATTPASTSGGNSTVSTHSDTGESALAQIINEFDPSHTTFTTSGGGKAYGIGNTQELNQIEAAARKANVQFNQTTAKAVGVPGGSTKAVYLTG